MGIFPSIYGLTASAVFLLVAFAIWREQGFSTFTQFDSTAALIESVSLLLGLTCLGLGFLLRYAPKFLLLYFLNFIAHPLTLIGGLLMLIHFFLRFNRISDATSMEPVDPVLMLTRFFM